MFWGSDFASCHNDADLDKYFAKNGQLRLTTCKCPRCGSRNLLLHEFYEATVTVTVKDGVLQEDFVKDYGPLSGVAGECLCCGHVWRLRGKTQIPDIVSRCVLDV